MPILKKRKRRGGRRRYRIPVSILLLRKRKSCPFKEAGVERIDYKDVDLLKQYVTEGGKIVPIGGGGVFGRGGLAELGGEVLEQDGFALGHDDGALDGVLKFAHVAGPVVGLKPGKGLGLEGLGLLGVGRVFGEEVVDELGNVVEAFA